MSEQALDINLTVTGRPENVAVVRRALAGLAQAAGAVPEAVGDVKTAVTEACMNAVVHAHPNGSEGLIDVSAEIDERGRLTVCVRDYGTGIQPRPLDRGGELSGMRIGLPLIGALADEFEISGGPGKGTVVRMTFDLEGASDEPAGEAAAPPLGKGETLLEVTPGGEGPRAISPVLTMLAARQDFSVDRLGDLQLIGDILAGFVTASADSRPLRIAIVEGTDSVDLSIGPLAKGAARAIIDRAELPGLGNALDRIATGVDVERSASEIDGEHPEFLKIRIAG